MKSRLVMFCCAAAMLAAALPAFGSSNTDVVIRAGTPEGARVLSCLEQARYVDVMNAQSNTAGYSSDARIYYYHKAQEIDSLLKRLDEGKSVRLTEVKMALDNSQAWRYGGNL
jgi:hypothetical protein